MKLLWIAIRTSVVLLVICGFIYPLVTTGIAQVLFPKQANGSLVEANGVVQGSELLAQEFTSPKLFHSRSSAAGYNPTSSSGSNKAVASDDYIKAIKEQVDALKLENSALKDIPADLVTTSGSGFDPDLSIAGAQAQVHRISQATGIAETDLNKLIDDTSKSRQLGIFGEPRVNIFQLNRELLKQVKL
ncbi:potassium-transporting ATPase subunit KdpC [Paenibacillus psychroresistens]|uniref:Potassium-transporting ATPase KdpC subunit n=1 Tax=Paenibacillus psychroresistens TaxID=1778678 RepID=A0A6B8RH07_9BACL|nr:potassium-transporting ATPase subunit KdpC [Paenibacillus psychroresistens]QGQ94668.1 potassium-transporting ATPase subunit KdpC [Paenibacillus psychroresistens]